MNLISRKKSPTPEDDIVAIRSRLIAERAAVIKRAEADVPTHSRTIDDAIAEVRAAESALATARDKLSSASSARAQASYLTDREINRLDAELKTTVSPAMDIFVAHCKEEWEKTLKTRIVRETSATKNPLTGEILGRIATNEDAIKHRIDAIRESKRQAEEELHLIADQDEVPARLVAMKASWPSANSI